MKKAYLLPLLMLSFFSLYGQAVDEPKDLLMNVTVAKDWSTVTSIENSFNTARRQEEMQLGLPANAIMNLDLPGQTTWDAFSIDQKALFIMNNERTSRAGINYGTGPVKGLPFNGVEGNIDAVAQNWSQHLINNNTFAHCHPGMTEADCPGGRIAGAYPAGCTEFGGGIENIYAHSSGTISPTFAALDAIFGWIYLDAGSAWGHRHAMLSQSYGDNFGEAMQEGFVGFGVAQTTNPAVTWKTVVTVNFTNPVSTAASANCGYNLTVTTNSLIPQPCIMPGITSVLANQPPDCNNQTGSISINATGTGTLEYSINEGLNWQPGNTFNNLNPGPYNVVVRFIDKLDCPTNYVGNPVLINAPMGCNTCTMVAAADLPKAIADFMTTSSTINFATPGVVTDINIKNVMGTHSFVGDLTFSLVSPQNTTVILLAKQCAGDDNFNLSFDDQAPASFTCPMNDGQTEKPSNPLTAFNGQNAMGNWTLQLLDDGAADIGSLTGWTLEICIPTVQCTIPVISSVAVTQPTCTPQSGAITINATGNGALEYSINNGVNWQVGNVFNSLTPGNYPVVVRLQAAPSCLTNGNPVVLNEPVNCAPCLSFNAGDVPKTISETEAMTTSTINFLTSGMITDINVKNVTGTHTYVGDLTFSLVGPDNTTVVLLMKQCASADNFSISFDDEAAAAFACPMSDGQTKKPANLLGAFIGKPAMGNWTLRVLDDGVGDVGMLNGWTLEICLQPLQCTPPVITNVASVQPSCDTQKGSITVVATGTGTLEYSVNNGTSWQTGNVFNDLVPGNYPVLVRLQSDQTCLTNYNQNPVVLNAASDCTNCLTFVAADLPKAIIDATENPVVITPTISTINVLRAGTITDVNIKNLTGTHSWVEDLTFTLISPQNTSVILLAGQCGSADNFNISFDDQAAPFACPMNDGQTKKPANPLEAFKGESTAGLWRLEVKDGASGDVGMLTGWTLELCGNFANASCPPNLNVDNYLEVNSGFFQAEIQVTCASTIPAGNNVTIQAGNNCELRPNFAVEQNATLEVKIGACIN